MKKSLVWSSVLLSLFMLTNSVSASQLKVIGTAQFVGETGQNDPAYKLIWDPDNNGNSVVWLDYTNITINNYTNHWNDQSAWAAGLDSALSISFYEGYSVDWSGSWRLPHASGAVDYNQIQTEMGHLFYTELGNLAYKDSDGNIQEGWGLQNTGVFENLEQRYYWAQTIGPYSWAHWYFNMNSGYQSFAPADSGRLGLAIRSGQVSTAPIPEPTTLLLFAVGLIGLAGISRRQKVSRC